MSDEQQVPGTADGTGAESGGVHRAGFVALVGRPNVGKSTLTNALVGEKVAITSTKPQTTRRAIRGIVTREDSQIILVDTPGVHRPRTLLGERLNDLVRETLGEVDVVGFCLPADQRVGPGDRRQGCPRALRAHGVGDGGIHLVDLGALQRSSPRSTWWGATYWPST